MFSASSYSRTRVVFFVVALSLNGLCVMCGFLGLGQIIDCVMSLDTLGVEVSASGITLAPQACAEVMYVFV